MPQKEKETNGNGSDFPSAQKSQVQIPVVENKFEPKYDPYAFSEDDFDESPIPILPRRFSSASSDSEDTNGITRPLLGSRTFNTGSTQFF